MKVTLRLAIRKPAELAGAKGETIDVAESLLLERLLKHGYVEPAKPEIPNQDLGCA